jgi:ubiquinone/menaquinone biosynthesis C-methylase UbiE
MNNLYNKLADVYDAIYQSFINYEEEFEFYNQILNKYSCTSVTELGCGTGNLSNHFNAHHIKYTGIDQSEAMLGIARNKFPKAAFLQGDMRHFHLPEKTESIILTGRTISYLLTNKDVLETFKTIHSNLTDGGILCFDFIDANRFIPLIKKKNTVTHYAEVNGVNYQRTSLWSINYNHSWSFNWHSVYYIHNQNGELVVLGEDHSEIRAFTKDEIQIFLELTGFEVNQLIDRASYAFDTFVVVAQKKQNQIN